MGLGGVIVDFIVYIKNEVNVVLFCCLIKIRLKFLNIFLFEKIDFRKEVSVV